jgi:hypothetical protein
MINITKYLYIRINVYVLTIYWSMDHVCGDNIYPNRVQIYHCFLDIKSEYHTTIMLILEVENDKKRTYCFNIPLNYLDDSLLGGLNEKYCLYCPN